MAGLTKCHFCGGRIDARSGPDRWAAYRGVRCEIPAELAVDTCTACGREWLEDAEIAVISAAFECQRVAAVPQTALNGGQSANTSAVAQLNTAIPNQDPAWTKRPAAAARNSARDPAQMFVLQMVAASLRG